MRLVSIVIERVRDGVSATAHILIERDGAIDREWNVIAGKPGATRRILLHDDERLVVEAVPQTELIYDKEHNLVSVVQKVVEEDDE